MRNNSWQVLSLMVYIQHTMHQTLINKPFWCNKIHQFGNISQINLTPFLSVFVRCLVDGQEGWTSNKPCLGNSIITKDLTHFLSISTHFVVSSRVRLFELFSFCFCFLKVNIWFQSRKRKWKTSLDIALLLFSLLWSHGRNGTLVAIALIYQCTPSRPFLWWTVAWTMQPSNLTAHILFLDGKGFPQAVIRRSFFPIVGLFFHDLAVFLDWYAHSAQQQDWPANGV